MALDFHPLDRLLELEGTGGSAIPYLGYVEVNLQIPGIKGYNEDILLLVIPSTTYSKYVSVMVGSKIIDRVMGMIMKGELARVTATWKQAHFSVVMSRSLQMPYKGTRGMGMLQRGLLPLSPPTLPHLRKSLWMVSKGMSIPHRVTISLFGTVNIHGNTDIWEHCMCVHMLAEPGQGPQVPPSWSQPLHMGSYTQAPPRCWSA